MFLTTDFPDLLNRSTGELAFPALSLQCHPSRTASALLQADVGWRSLLYDEERTLSALLSSMQEVAGNFLHVDAALSTTLNHL